MALGRFAVAVANIRDATSFRLKELLCRVPEDVRCKCLAIEAAFVNSIAEDLKVKLRFYGEWPYKFLFTMSPYVGGSR
eukprot:4652586-Lingulodinium_polyedra.AAC.1